MEEKEFVKRVVEDCISGISQLNQDRLVKFVAKETKLPPPIVTTKILQHLLYVIYFREDFLAGKNTDKSFEILIKNEQELFNKGFSLKLLTNLQSAFVVKSEEQEHTNLQKIERKISQLLEEENDKINVNFN